MTEPTIKKQLNAIRKRADTITGNHSWPNYPWPDPTNERIKKLEKENAELRKRFTVDDAKIERVARELAHLEPGEAWPTTRELGGEPRSKRDEEYRTAMREWAQKVIHIVFGAEEDEWA